MSANGKNFIAFVCGMKRSGKSHLLDSLAARFPRRIIFDFVGEYDGRFPDVKTCYTLPDAVSALLRAAKRGDKWTVVCTLDNSEIVQLLAAITGRSSWARTVGGVVIQCGEVDLIAPNNAGIATEVRHIFQRGRHYGISALVATQRPRDVHRVVTAQSDIICAFRQHEPRDADYLGEVMRSDAVPLLRELRQYEYLRYFPNYGKLEIVDKHGAVKETVNAQ